MIVKILTKKNFEKRKIVKGISDVCLGRNCSFFVYSRVCYSWPLIGNSLECLRTHRNQTQVCWSNRKSKKHIIGGNSEVRTVSEIRSLSSYILHHSCRRIANDNSPCWVVEAIGNTGEPVNIDIFRPLSTKCLSLDVRKVLSRETAKIWDITYRTLSQKLPHPRLLWAVMGRCFREVVVYTVNKLSWER